MKQRFTVTDRLPGYNELHQANWHVSHRIKQDGMNAVIWAAKIAKIKPVQSKCVITIACYEPNARRDPDNVKTGANKVILDALQQMGILAGDGRKYISDVVNPRVEVDKENPRIEITIKED